MLHQDGVQFVAGSLVVHQFSGLEGLDEDGISIEHTQDNDALIASGGGRRESSGEVHGNLAGHFDWEGAHALGVLRRLVWVGGTVVGEGAGLTENVFH